MSDKVIALKSKKKRTFSSRVWLLRQLNDPFVLRAKEEGFRSRAAYKLMAIDDKFKLLRPHSVVVDLGCAPGGWLQIIRKRVSNGFILGIDLQDVEPLPGVTFLRGDFTDSITLDKFMNQLAGRKVDVVLSDLAAAACGIPKVDHIRIMGLVKSVFQFSLQTLSEGGAMVAKVLRGGTEDQLLKNIKQRFRRVTHFKPPASRDDSAEMYIVAQGFRSLIL